MNEEELETRGLELLQRVLTEFVLEQRADMRDRLNRLLRACAHYRQTGDLGLLDTALAEWPAGVWLTR